MLLIFLRDAASRIAVTPASRLEQLFMLECSARAGAAATTVVASLRSLPRDAAWRMDNEWERDVPHAAELAQLLCVRDVCDEDVPMEWVMQLTEVCVHVAARRGRFTATADPIILATLLRGLAVGRQPVPDGLATPLDAVIKTASDPVALALLGDATARHLELQTPARLAVERLFSGTMDAAYGTGLARWWLSARWSQPGAPAFAPAISAAAVEVARVRSLGGSLVDAPARHLALAIEVAGRSASKLVVQTADEVLAGRDRRERRAEAELFLWRHFAAAIVLAVALVNTPRLLGWLLPHIGNHPVGPDTEAPVGALFAGASLYCVAAGLLASISAWKGRRFGRIETFLNLFLGAVGAAVAAIVYIR